MGLNVDLWEGKIRDSGTRLLGSGSGTGGGEEHNAQVTSEFCELLTVV